MDLLTDHLGSTRAVVTPSGAVSERNDYMPFGSRWEVPGAAITDNRFRFSGKEDQTTGNLTYKDFGARFLGKKLPIWTSPDPLVQKYPWISPYAYCHNDPVNRVFLTNEPFTGKPTSKVYYSMFISSSLASQVRTMH